MLNRVSGQRPECRFHFAIVKARQQHDGPHLVAVEILRETAERWLRRIGRLAVDDQLAVRDAQDDTIAPSQDASGAPDEGTDDRLERRVAARVHAELVQRNRQLEKKLADLGSRRGPSS